MNSYQFTRILRESIVLGFRSRSHAGLHALAHTAPKFDPAERITIISPETIGDVDCKSLGGTCKVALNPRDYLDVQ